MASPNRIALDELLYGIQQDTAGVINFRRASHYFPRNVIAFDGGCFSVVHFEIEPRYSSLGSLLVSRCVRVLLSPALF
jgi:hypothetical protein